jgi:hypothetical protein
MQKNYRDERNGVFLFPVAQQTNSGLDHLIVEVYRYHTIRLIHMVRFL